MTEWGVFSVISALLVFVVGLGTPILKLNYTIARLVVLLDEVQKRLDGFIADNKQDHANMYGKFEKHDSTLSDHEGRLTSIERRDV